MMASRLRALDARLGHAERREVLAQRREVAALHALELNAQHHDHVGAFDRFVDAGRDAHAHLLQARRNQRRRRAHPHFGAELGQQQHVRSQHAAVQQVADDRDLQALAGGPCARGS